MHGAIPPGLFIRSLVSAPPVPSDGEEQRLAEPVHLADPMTIQSPINMTMGPAWLQALPISKMV